jgi:hypothetical protein
MSARNRRAALVAVALFFAAPPARATVVCECLPCGSCEQEPEPPCCGEPETPDSCPCAHLESPDGLPKEHEASMPLCTTPEEGLVHLPAGVKPVPGDIRPTGPDPPAVALAIFLRNRALRL